MSKLIDVDKIDWQKGVFVNPNTEEPLPIIHKIATIEMLRDWQEEVKAIPIDKVKAAREDMENKVFETLDDDGSDWFTADKVSECMAILDKLIAESE